MLVDWFKRVTGEKLFFQPLAAETNNRRRLDRWFGRLLSSFKKLGSDQGHIFHNNSGKGMSITEMDVLFHGLLREVQQQNPLVIPNSMNIEESYSVYISLCQEATLKAQNVNMLEEVMNANNR